MNEKDKKENKELILKHLKKAPIVYAVCERVGVPRSTFYRWKTKDKEFAEKVDKALVDGKYLVNDLAESVLISGIKEKNMTSVIFWLKNNHKNYKTRVELSGKVKTETQLTPEQEKEINRALRLASLSDGSEIESSNK